MSNNQSLIPLHHILIRKAKLRKRAIAVAINPDVCVADELPHALHVCLFVEVETRGCASKVRVAVDEGVLEAVREHDLENGGAVFGEGAAGTGACYGVGRAEDFDALEGTRRRFWVLRWPRDGRGVVDFREGDNGLRVQVLALWCCSPFFFVVDECCW